MSKRLAPYGNQYYAGSFAAVGTINKGPRLAPYGNEQYAGSFATVGNINKASDLDPAKADARGRLVRLKAKAD